MKPANAIDVYAGPTSMIVWFVGFLVLRLVSARIAVRAGRGTYLDLLTSMRWLTERGMPWTKWGWALGVWIASAPVLIGGALLAVAWHLKP